MAHTPKTTPIRPTHCQLFRVFCLLSAVPGLRVLDFRLWTVFHTSAPRITGRTRTAENLVSRASPKQAPTATARRTEEVSARRSRKEKYSAAVTNRAARVSLVMWWERQRFAGR